MGPHPLAEPKKLSPPLDGWTKLNNPRLCVSGIVVEDARILRTSFRQQITQSAQAAFAVAYPLAVGGYGMALGHVLSHLVQWSAKQQHGKN